MKKYITIILLSILMVFMTGCDNATANVSDSNKMLMKIGKTTYTKGQLYDDMMEDDAANTVVSEAMQMIADAEVETTADLQQEAQKIYDDYHDQIMATTDEPFEEAIKLYGYESVEDFRDYCLSSAKTNHLTEQYIDEKWDDLLVEYYPLKARMIYVSAQEHGPELSYSKAGNALAALKNGASFDDVAEEYSDNISLAD
ncbi:MAG: hypothetical protein IJI05_04280, partial [Erysipelotrichaceae bacterium]|nr:hypothetical protein [Erysipelotrichaceae bacterium]